MEPAILYLVKINVSLTIFYLLYVWLLKHDTFFKLRRTYWLIVITFSFLYPFISVEAWSTLFEFLRLHAPEDLHTQVFIGNPQAGSIIPDDTIVNTPIITRQQIFIVSWIIGALFLIGRLGLQLISIFNIKRHSVQKSFFGILIHDLSEDITPFSFFRWIFIHVHAHSEEELRQIVTHEKTHVRQWHSADILLAELLCIAFWWNPFTWWIKREIAINLEYLADSNVLESGINSREYQYHLLRLTYHETAVQIVNNFNVSQLKNRIMMMNKSKSPAKKLAKYLLLLPLTLLLVAANSAYAQKKEPVKTEQSPQSPPKKTKQNDEVFMVVEKQPEFPGGMYALMKYLSSNIMYPVEAQKQNIQGRVICTFIVEKDGSLSDIKVNRGIDPLLDEESVRVIESMPSWKPGMQRGKKVRTRFTLPIVFRLQGDDKKSPIASPPPPPPPAYTKSKDDLKNSNEVFMVVENQPEFQGGISALMKYLSDNIRYPVEAQKRGTQGRVVCNFVVMKDGTISDINVVRSVDGLLDAEAIRVIKAMPKWKPGMQKGQPVNVRFTLPVVFRLKKTTDNDDAMKKLQKEGSVAVYDHHDSQPDSNYLKFLAKSIKYPVIAQENGIMGLVEAVYSVNNEGKITAINITKGVDPSLDSEVKRVIRSLPPHITLAKTEGKANSAVDFSAFFRLQNGNSSTLPSLSHKPDVIVVGYGKEKK